MQLYRPPPLPPISELARPELKLAGVWKPVSQQSFCILTVCTLRCITRGYHLKGKRSCAGLRIDAEIFGSSRMGYSTGNHHLHLTTGMEVAQHL